MSLVCQLSGEIPTEPVVDKQGHLFERRLIEAQLDKSARCPIDGEALDKKDLIAISQILVRAPSAVLGSDWGSLVRALHDHHDSLALECQQLRLERDNLRKAVTHNLYLRDAATSLLATKMDRLEFLEKENKALQSKLAETESAEAKRKRPRVDADQTTVASMSFPSILEAWGELSKTMLQGRRRRVVNNRPLDEIKTFQVKQSQKCAVADASSLSLVTSVRSETQALPHLVAVGGRSGEIEIRDLVRNKTMSILNGHDAPVTSMLSLLYPSVSHIPQSALSALRATSSSSQPFRSCLNVISGDAHGIINIWRETSCKSMESIDWLMDHNTPFGISKNANPDKLPDELHFSNQIIDLGRGPIKQLKMHPSGTHVGVVNAEQSGWSLLNVISGQIAKVYEDAPTPVEDLAFQPDGLVVIGAGAGVLPVWDLRLPRIKAQCKPPNESDCHFTSINFSEAGYYMVTATREGKGHLWDLRKSAVVQEYDLGHRINSARFDYSGMHIIFSTDEGARLYSTKEKKNLVLYAQWEDGMKVIDSAFEFLSDDYLVSLRDDGIVDIVAAGSLNFS
eukprot:Gregarina_sp_Pseudo_9__1482@NODE_19_length_5871_cov_29_635631_g17_i0_p2_GENE_NODE_19_length_5871_cov_29_635631_g17_i0NODE_19_length_5871_cov_29_635631_g17_i0_p2_ORF_typecomplete_len566_score114_58ANAPC4_WD40/PF12894_7/0_23ANAPC4_WD40/PF12894_7/3_4ANAPC4_WD40/PF12894_7/0_00021Ubox/PF04564_15/7_9e09eIF2A/PF08662_11/5_5e03eIF2A/PF08662_11/5_5e03eIF2A/PF08662_11/0_0052eIF2A/PF08662_11/0_00082zfNse/PF11789_8/0_00033zfNse/PF11789_8/1_1e04Prp19/PF08606_11/0_00086WD40_like/PF17005_5/8_3WD40_like/PF17005